ncbi:hypothetical protein [Hymenobacter ruricola]|uniref:Cardiolipin synthase N-terminal domain-containing protein n=1 Tax=Hymenobacter ruricola TaxID=2791023 RepID=A0ABS0IAR8_9BACT|nr:hypothetical protein [Hymenobacter ruricola]MBF9223667.1 hypothetical protein [Hymenobacter ruricola]
MNPALDSPSFLVFSVLAFFTEAVILLYLLHLAPKKNRNTIAGAFLLIFISSVALVFYVLHGGFSHGGFSSAAHKP